MNDLAQAFELAERLGLAPYATTLPGDGPDMNLVSDPIGLSATPAHYRLRPPRLGEHTEEITAWLDDRDPGRFPPQRTR